jgi:hypothetical protein
MDDFIKLTDDYIFNGINILENFKGILSPQQTLNISNAKHLYDKLIARDLYGIICSISSKEKITTQNITKNLPDMDNIIVHEGKIGFVSGNKPNPFDNIYIYKTKDTTQILNAEKNLNKHIKLEAHLKHKNEITMLTDNYQEYFVIFYYKDKQNTERILELNALIKQFFT